MLKDTSYIKGTVPISKDMIKLDLLKLGVFEDDVLLIHSSLSKLGYVIGGAQTLFEALMDAVGILGTIVVPTQTMDNSDPSHWENPPVPVSWFEAIRNEIPAFNKHFTPTRQMGKFVEFVRTHPNTLRSNHPQVSFAAHGYQAKSIVKHHDLTPKFGLLSPLGKLYSTENAKILIIGAPLNTCTALHLSQCLADIDPKETNGCAMIIEHQRKWMTYVDYEYDCSLFDDILNQYINQNHIKSQNIGGAESYLFSFKEIVDFGTNYFKQAFKQKKV